VRFSDRGGPSVPAIASEHAICLQCGYQIRGMASDRNCPECGTPISRSLRGNLLIFSASNYLRSLHMGLICILLAAILQALFGLIAAAGGIFIAVSVAMSAGAGGGGGPNPAIMQNLQLWIGAGTMPIAALSLVGWWLFSAPDPAVVHGQTGQSARVTIRITVAVVAVASILNFAFIVASQRNPAMIILTSVAGILSGIASLVQFFASMLYVRWLAPRLPDLALINRATLYMWLLPVIYVVGMCLLIGPLVAQIMYLLMLNGIRIRLRIIRERQALDFPEPVT